MLLNVGTTLARARRRKKRKTDNSRRDAENAEEDQKASFVLTAAPLREISLSSHVVQSAKSVGPIYLFLTSASLRAPRESFKMPDHEPSRQLTVGRIKIPYCELGNHFSYPLSSDRRASASSAPLRGNLHALYASTTARRSTGLRAHWKDASARHKRRSDVDRTQRRAGAAGQYRAELELAAAPKTDRYLIRDLPAESNVSPRAPYLAVSLLCPHI